MRLTQVGDPRAFGGVGIHHVLINSMQVPDPKLGVSSSAASQTHP
jgi:hypothetical protein